MLFASTLTSHADTTTDNLLSNGNFSNQLNDWTVEDSTKTKYDANCYAGGTDASGLCKSVRWSSDLGKTISQTITNLQEGYDIDNINVSFTALGCNNEANSSTWCTQGTDYDKVQAVIELYDGTNTETLVLEQTLDYNDGTQDYSLSTQTLDSWTTDNTSIDFSITGIDTGDWSGWYAPIVDNINLNLTISETPVPVVEPVVVEPVVIEPIVVIEETLIEGLSLDTEIVNDVILQPVAIEVPTLPDLPDLPEVSEITPEVPEISVNIEVPEISVDIDIPEIPVEVPEIEVVEEIQEIQVNEPVEEIAEVDVDIETPEELNTEDTHDEDIQESATNDEPEPETEEVAEAEPESDTSENTDSESTTTAKNDKSDSKDSKKEKKSKKKVKKEVAKKTADNKSVAKVNKKSVKKTNKPSSNASSLGQIDITTMVYLQVIPQTITIQETVSLTQEMIYEQDIGALASSDAYDSLIGSASRRWVRMVDVRPKHTFSGYGR
jgi:hypothetical protein